MAENVLCPQDESNVSAGHDSISGPTFFLSTALPTDCAQASATSAQVIHRGVRRPGWCLPVRGITLQGIGARKRKSCGRRTVPGRKPDPRSHGRTSAVDNGGGVGRRELSAPADRNEAAGIDKVCAAGHRNRRASNRRSAQQAVTTAVGHHGSWASRHRAYAPRRTDIRRGTQ
jgi:hypothetical protein